MNTMTVSLPLSPASLVTWWRAGADKPVAANHLVRHWCDDFNKKWKVTLWDTTGQEALRQLRNPGYPGTQVLLLGFDMTNGVSLENLPEWIEEAKEEEPNLGCIIVVGTNSDGYINLEGGDKDPDGSDLKTIEQMHARAVAVGANAFICTSAQRIWTA